MSYSHTLYDFESLTDEKYNDVYDENIENFDKFQLEHQIGRFNSIKKILRQIKEKGLGGDILEFGSWQGQSIYNILNILEKLEITDKKVIGIDGFIGIPEGYGHINCQDGLFNDTSKDLCIKNINDHSENFPSVKDNFQILQSLYKEYDIIKSFLDEKQVKKTCFIHLDCDVVKSCEEVLFFLHKFDLLENVFYLHFDDWGIDTGIPEWFYEFTKKDFLNEYNCFELYSTRLTKSFMLEKK